MSTHRGARSLSVSALCLLLWGCADSQMGELGALRFGQVVQYAETRDFSSGIAAGQKMPLGLQDTEKPALLNDYPYLEGSLSIVRESDGVMRELEPTAPGKFEAVFETPGDYTLLGRAEDRRDELSVRVVAQSGLRLARAARSLTTRPAGTACTSPVPDGSPLPSLSSNQSLSAAVVPTDAAGAPLLGVLALRFESEGMTVTKALGPNANWFDFAPLEGRSGPTEVTVHDEVTGQSATLTFEVRADAAPCPAQGQ